VRIGGGDIGDTSFAFRAQPGGEERDVVSGIDQTVGEQRNDELDTA